MPDFATLIPYWPYAAAALAVFNAVVGVKVWRVAGECRRHTRTVVAGPGIEVGAVSLKDNDVLELCVVNCPDVLTAVNAAKDHARAHGFKPSIIRSAKLIPEDGSFRVILRV